MKKTIAGLALAAFGSVASVGSADTATTKVTSVDAHSSYIEIATDKTVCGGLSGSWGKRPRILNSEGLQAEFTLKLAMAALLSGKDLYVDADVSGSRCIINYVQLND